MSAKSLFPSEKRTPILLVIQPYPRHFTSWSQSFS